MPRGDGTGPMGQGGGRGMGRGRGMGQMSGNRAGMGQGGSCVCPQCGKRIPHQVGVPCNSIQCLSCKTNMVRG